MPLIKSGSKAAISPTEADVAYAAGLFDGEGSISAPASVHCKKNIRIHVSVIMCDRAPIDFLAAAFGGKVRVNKAPTKSGKPIYGWHRYCRNAADFLSLVLPFLRVKQEKAKDAILLAPMMRPRGGDTRNCVITDREIELRLSLAARIKAANIATNARVACHAAN